MVHKTKSASKSNKSPIFPVPQPQHFSDYGFQPQIDYFHFQVLEEARKQKREKASRSMDIHFKLQKPISKDESSKKNKKRWWRNPLRFFKFPKSKWGDLGHRHRIASISGPIYSTESRSTSSTPYQYFSLRELNTAATRRSSAPETPIYLVT